MKLYPLQIDPPYQTGWRAALGPFFSARVVGELEGSIREHADYLVDSFIGDGSCDFVDTFAAQPPGRVFFGSFLKVAFSELPAIQKATDDAIRGPAEGRAAAWQSVGGFLMESMKMRADEPPRGDFVDVVMKHPEDAARLASEPELRANFVEEVIRVYAPVFALGRTATKDTEIAGQKIAEGDMGLQMVMALEVLLRRLPDLAVAAGEKPVYSNSGVARSMDRLPLVSTPGHRSVSAE